MSNIFIKSEESDYFIANSIKNRKVSLRKKMASSPFIIGMAMFSMFFGSGNIVFPLAIGKIAKANYILGMTGLILTSVLIPFSGVISIVLFNGEYRKFFLRMGKIPGYYSSLLIIFLIGSFGVVPRCITISCSTLKTIFPNITLLPFSLVACLIIFVLSIKQNKVIDIIGKYLTPILIISLFSIIISGIFFTESPILQTNFDGKLNTFFKGLSTGYHTMDLLAAFFFSNIVVSKIKSDPNVHQGTSKDIRLNILKKSIKSSLIGGILLTTVYASMGFLTSKHSLLLNNFSDDQLLGKISMITLGQYASIIANIIATFATLTTAIALTTVFSQFVSKSIFKNKVNIKYIIFGSVLITLFVSNLSYSGIMMILGPAVQIIYPSMIVLTFCNILYKIFGFRMVKVPVYLTLAFSFYYYF